MLADLSALFLESPLAFSGSAFLVGLVVGSFLNVVIYRLPLMLEREWRAQAAELLHPEPAQAPGGAPRDAPLGGAAVLSTTGAGPLALPPQPGQALSLSVPRSACPKCHAPIKAWQNIPVVSWLVLRGRCAACKSPISVRYPAVELATAVLSAAVAWHFGWGVAAVGGIALTWALVALCGIDIDHQLLPDVITLPLLWAGLTAAVLFHDTAGASLPVSPREAILGAAAGYVSLWSVFQLFRLVTGKEGMGYGDFKLFAALGAWLGWQLLPLIIVLAAATGAVLGLLLIVVRGRDRAAPLPFGPYLAAAGWIAMLYGEPLIDAYLRLSGLKH